MISPTLHRQGGDKAAFTLVEVMLAIIIALAILVVLLFFYQQATRLRSDAIEQTEQIGSIRLLMDRITTELRSTPSATPFGRPLTGTSNTIEFVRAEVPNFSAWTGSALGRATSPNSDLKIVRYAMYSPSLTNVAGLLRTEEPVVGLQQTSEANLETAGTNGLAAGFPPVVEQIRHVQFRYWNGSNWLDGWNYQTPPRGVEVSLAAEPLTNETENADYPVEIFRRVISLASAFAAAPAEPEATLSSPPSSSGEAQ